MSSQVVIALDFSSKDEVMNFVKKFQKSLYVKVGMELFYKEGPAIIKELKELGHQIFLDLKLHDIPNTVKHAMKNIASLEVDMVNVHAAGGTKMMKAALEGLEEGTPAGKKRPLLIAVTQLTSTSEEQVIHEQGISSLQDSIKLYAAITEESGLDGVVCSPLDVELVQAAVEGENFLTVTPGIRLADNSVDDQVRVTTPAKARQFGSSYIVVGRSITKSENPVEAYEEVIAQWEGVTI
ncbi:MULTISPECIES: orotidine-5'-phosphate decarboxylase [Bacillaceae]|jgi:orotidine-5'-phosphate decarboxylase|uniref:orotidine-5'-phosphate decarboxylase n=1 Tax=Bacillaceae TaxID=186817 RepID=UPI0006FCC3A9|nr:MULTISPECIES: orotidine-5'-phosphate decarboxylase [Bacillaceae]KQL39496.1 orotidine 5'-phosphate decarboxylase [Bacillus sp. FJAT-25509]